MREEAGTGWKKGEGQKNLLQILKSGAGLVDLQKIGDHFLYCIAGGGGECGGVTAALDGEVRAVGNYNLPPVSGLAAELVDSRVGLGDGQ